MESSFTTSKKKLLFIGIPVILIILVLVFFLLREENVPTHLSAETVSYDEIKLTWIGDENARRFNIYRAENPDGPFRTRVGYAEENEYVDTGLEPSTKYYYKVKQVIDFQESSFSSMASAQTSPRSPRGLKAEAASFHENLESRIELTWDYSVGAEEYIIYRSEDEGGIYEKIGTAVNENYSDTNISPETTYYYAVTQIEGEEESVYSDEVSATTGPSWACEDNLEYGEESYETIRLGDQCWFQENLNVTEGNTNLNCEITRHCYGDNRVNCIHYGGLYSFQDAACNENYEGLQGICPLGWRIPTNEDWVMLETELGMRESEAEKYGFRGSNEGSKLAGRYDLWERGMLKENNEFANSGFNVLPSGYQPAHNPTLFYGKGEKGIFWSSTLANEDEGCAVMQTAYSIREIEYDNTRVGRDCVGERGTASIRCVRDY